LNGRDESSPSEKLANAKLGISGAAAFSFADSHSRDFGRKEWNCMHSCQDLSRKWFTIGDDRLMAASGSDLGFGP
jgi:hypothetical protein